MPHIPLSLYPRHIACDFEYRLDGRQLVVGCFYVEELDEWIDIDFRDPEAGRRQLRDLYDRFNHDIFVTYGGWEIAEIQCFERAGIDVRGMHWIDLYTEANQVLGGYDPAGTDGFWLPTDRRGLLAVLEKFSIPTRGSAIAKQRSRDVILATDQYTDDQWTAIVDYCHSDIEPLSVLRRRLLQLLNPSKRVVPYTEKTMLYHGDYLVAQAHLDARSRGFPIDVPLLRRITEHRQAVCNHLAERCNEHFGAPLYHWLKREERYAFSEAVLRQVAHQHDVLLRWELTPHGRLRTAEDYLDTIIQDNPFFAMLAETRRTMRDLAKIDLEARLTDGFIKGLNAPLHAVTGRNQPMASKGMILNLSRWLRCLMRPPQGYCVVAADWSQQEQILAAAFSGDERMIECIKSGDMYLALARMAGRIEEGDAPEHVARERSLFKSLQLGLGYGLGRMKLGPKMHADALARGIVLDLDEMIVRGVEMWAWHKATFKTYWAWQKGRIATAHNEGCIYTPDNWTLFVHRKMPWPTRDTTVGNFPMQGGAASVLREAIKLLAKEDDVEFIASHHDAIYLLVQEDDVLTMQAKLQRCMRQAADKIMSIALKPLTIGIDVAVYTHDRGYHDKRGEATLATVLALLDSIEAVTVETPAMILADAV